MTDSSHPPQPDPAPPKPGGLRRLLAHLRNRFFAGFALAIPVIITAWLLVLSYRFILFVGEP
ncbi:MAG: hypothetical protein KDM63_08765, partial [Verrucomicrobiae bacterium]|nr:hypothetical protein [Verrucomicrobiae bacterium]